MKRKTKLASLAISLALATTITYVGCRKDSKHDVNNNSSSLVTSVPNARLKHSYSAVQYDAGLGMLAFKDANSYRQVLSSLSDEKKNFQFDNGKTENLLQLLAPKHLHGDELYDTLVNNSPLSDTVIATLLKGNHVHGKIKKVLEQNLAFSENIETLFNNVGLESNIIQEINNLRSNYIPQDFILLAFQSQFPGFKSYLNKFLQEEFIFLKNGGDPQDPNNPANKVKVDRTLATLFNENKEIKIGNSIMIMLPGRDVYIKNGDINTLNYVRKNGTVPINTPKGVEPDNGYAIANGPAPVDTNILVIPVDQVNGACGGVISNQPSSSERLSFSSGIKGTGLTYYWNFGDGYVSYKENPTHRFPTKGDFNVTVVVYDAEGVGCTPIGTSQVGTGNSTNGTQCAIPNTNGASFSVSGNYLSVSANATGLPFGVTYSWDFGDLGFAGGNPATHNYQVAGSYPVTLIATDANGCTWTHVQTITVTSPPPASTGNCCDKRDKAMDHWNSLDSKHKFRHILNVKHAFTASTDRVSGEVITYHKFIFANWWIISLNQSSVNISGTVYNTHGNTFCTGSEYVTPTINNGNAFWNTASYNTSADPVYTDLNSVFSSATAFGYTDVLYVSDCQ